MTITGTAFPPGACDTHFHVFGHDFPTVPNAAVTSADATIAQYEAVAQAASIARAVVIQPSCYGTDNRCLLQALAGRQRWLRGVAVVDDSIGDDELDALHVAGVRGIRFNQVQAGATTLAMLLPLARRIERLGWHIQLHMPGADLPGVELLLRKLPVPLVLDHIGRVSPAHAQADVAWACLLRLLDTGRTWIKLSAPYLESANGALGQKSLSSQARELVQRVPERLFWASDWPHATERHKPAMPELQRFLLDNVPDEATGRRILIDNPAAFYGF